MIEQKYITLVHRIIFTAAFLVQLDIEFKQLSGGTKSPDTKIINPGIDFRTIRIDGHLLAAFICLNNRNYIAEACKNV
jgi:hypothetical protein